MLLLGTSGTDIRENRFLLPCCMEDSPKLLMTATLYRHVKPLHLQVFEMTLICSWVLLLTVYHVKTDTVQ